MNCLPFLMMTVALPGGAEPLAKSWYTRLDQ
jgi:hypothetical protein